MRNQLIQLLADNRRPFAPMAQKIVQAEGSAEATVYLYDAIVGDRVTAEWWGGVCPQDFVPALAAIQADVIHLRVNSPGGDVFAAEAICQALREHSAKVVAHIEGVAASAATTVCCAADEVIMTPASKYMIHKAWTLALGNADDMRSTAELLDLCDASMLDAYEARTGEKRAQLEAWCKAETWFSAAQAVQHKFADSLSEGGSAKAQHSAATVQQRIAAAWNLRAYSHAPADLVASHAPLTITEQNDTASTDHRHRQQQRMRAALLTSPIV